MTRPRRLLNPRPAISRPASLLVTVMLFVASCGGSSSPAGDQAGGADGIANNAPTETRATIDPTTTTAVADQDEQVADLEPYNSTVGEYLDQASITFPVVADMSDAGMPAADLGGAFGGEIEPGASVFVLGDSIADQSRGAVVVVDVSDGVTPTQLVAFALSGLDLADPDFDGYVGPDPVDRFASEVVPALSTISETVQRFDLGGTTLELTIRDDDTLVFTFVKSGQEIPPLVEDLG